MKKQSFAVESLTRNSQKMLKRAEALGLTAKKGTPLTLDHMHELLAALHGFRNAHAYRKSLKEREPAALEQENPAEAGNDYKLVNGRGCWITMGAFSVHPYLTDEGVVVDVYPLKAEIDSIATTYAFNADAEAAYCEHEGIDFEEAQAWAATQGLCDWNQEEPASRMQWLHRFAESRRLTIASESQRPPQLLPYRVMLREEAGDKFQLTFDCLALDTDHAEEQALQTHPGAQVVNCLQLDDAALILAIYSPNESALNDGAGYWNNQDGWTEQEHATLFSARDVKKLNLPISTGQDARWVLVSAVS